MNFLYNIFYGRRRYNLNNILIISTTENSSSEIQDLLSMNYDCNIVLCDDKNAAQNNIGKDEFDLCIIDMQNDDEGVELAAGLVSNTLAGVIVLCDKTSFELESAIEKFGIIIINKPIDDRLFLQSVKLAKAMKARLELYHRENLQLKNKINELRIVDRAKSVLMQYLNMTEAQAHHFIVKQAMNMRMTKAQIAQNILKTYET